MRMRNEAPEIEGSDPIASDQMGIRERDMAIVLDILRSKLWATAQSGRLRLRHKDPLKAAVREYVCNARDAHRENGNPAEPVHVVLPTELSKPLLRRSLAAPIEIQDVGTGISLLGMEPSSSLAGPTRQVRSTKPYDNRRPEAQR